MDDLVEVRLVDVHEVAGTVHPGVVEDHVERAERVDRRPDHGLHLGAVGDVDADGRSAAAALDDGVCHRLRRNRVEVGDDDLPTLGAQRVASRRADTAGSACDDHDAVLDTPHLDPRYLSDRRHLTVEQVRATHVRLAADEELLGREPGDHAIPGCGDDDLLLDAGCDSPSLAAQ